MSLKNIYNPLLKYGIQRVTDDSEWVVPADALVIDKLSQNYIADASTPENIKINDITRSGLQFVLPTSLSSDKYINIYIDKASGNGLYVNDGVSVIPFNANTHVECYYSASLGSWSVTYEQPKQQTLVCTFADYKTISAQQGGGDSGYWYHVGKLKTTYPSYANHVIAFKIFSEQGYGHSGKCVYAEAFYNLNTIGGIFFCTTCESRGKSGSTIVNDWFRPEHIVSVTTGTRTGANYTSDIWIKLPNDTAVYFAIEMYGGTGVNKWSWASNTWNGYQEFKPAQPTGSNVHVCEDKTEADIPADVLRAETQGFPMDILLEVLSSQNIQLLVQSTQTTDLQTRLMLDNEEASLQARRIRRLVRDDYVLATEDGEAEFNVESGGYINVNATELFNILAKDMQFNGRTVPTLLRSFADGDTIVAEDSAHFYASDSISSLTVTGVYNPLQPNWHVTFAISFVTAASGAISVTFPAEYKFTSVPVFGNNERWEIAMRDNYVVWTKYDL